MRLMTIFHAYSLALLSGAEYDWWGDATSKRRLRRGRQVETFRSFLAEYLQDSDDMDAAVKVSCAALEKDAAWLDRRISG